MFQVVFNNYHEGDRQHAKRVEHLGDVLSQAGYLVFIDDWQPSKELWDRFYARMIQSNVSKVVACDRCASPLPRGTIASKTSVGLSSGGHDATLPPPLQASNPQLTIVRYQPPVSTSSLFAGITGMRWTGCAMRAPTSARVLAVTRNGGCSCSLPGLMTLHGIPI